MALALARKREVPWLGMGTTGEWDNVEAALYDAGLGYEVTQTYAYDDMGNQLPGVLVNRRTDTCEIMGVTSDAYGVIQNYDAFSLLEPFCKAGGVIEHAGITEVGMIFMVMRVPGMAFGIMDDAFEMYVCAMNSFNTRFPLAVIITPIRVFCQNMFRKLMKKSDTVTIIKHGRFAKDRILSVSKVNNMLVEYMGDFTDTLSSYYHKPRLMSDVEQWVNDMFPLVPVGPEHPRAHVSNLRIEAQRREFMEEYYHAPDNEMYEGTKLGLVNAYYDWITHNKPVRVSPTFESTRFGNLVNGSAVNRKAIVSA